MNAAAMAMEQCKLAGNNSISGLLTFVGLPSKASGKDLTASAEELFEGIAKFRSDIISTVINSRTREEFIESRKQMSGDYFKITYALAGLAQVVIPARSMDKLVAESFSELEADLRDEGLKRFGIAARDQAVFTVWTLRKISRLLSNVVAYDAAPGNARIGDAKLVNEFSFHIVWTQFHLSCLIASIQLDKSINPEILDEICDGLKGAVNAYGIIRESLDLRSPNIEEPVLEPYAWDEEDQGLMESSMKEMESDLT